MSLSIESKTRRQNKKTKPWLGYVLAFVLAVGAFFSGLQLGHLDVAVSQPASLFSSFFSSPAVEAEADAKPSLDDFWHVWDLLEDKYALSSSTEIVSDEDKIRGAIDGLVDSYGDPYTIYLPPKDAEAFDVNIAGNFSGVGMEVGLRNGVITVIAPLPDTPAMAAGVLAGDVVVRIDETTTEDMNIDEAVSLIRGEKGTVVTLQIYRDGENEFRDIPITRDTINIPTVKTEKIEDVFVISIYSFNAVAQKQVQDALKEYLRSGAQKLIVDVRGNPGGYLESAVGIASYFLPAGKVIVQESFSDNTKDDVFRSHGRQIQQFTPENLVVLVDKGSASASEILAGALRDHEIATIIGQQTFGKGSVQELVKLDDGSSLKVTIARWLTPAGVSISDGGLTPDIIIDFTNEDRLADIDPQRDAAVRFLRGEEVVSMTEDSALDTLIGE